MTNEELKFFETFIDRYQNDPIAWCYDILDCEKLEWYQEEALIKLCNDRFVSMACGGGIGKTFILNVCALWFLTTHPGCNIIATAPTDKQLKSALWKELVIWIKKSRGGILKEILDWNQDKIWVRGSKEDWFILARTASKDGSSDVSEALSGIHSDYGVLFLVDEACLSSDTEILTNNGWKNADTITPEDKVATKDTDNRTTFIKPTHYFKKDYKGEMINFKSHRCDLLVTPNHKMYRHYRKSDKWDFCDASDCPDEVFFKRDAEFLPNVPDEDTTYSTMLGWYLSEGWANEYTVGFTQCDNDNRQEIVECLQTLGFNPKIYYNKEVQVHSKDFSSKLVEQCGKGFDEKRIPRFLFDASKTQQRAFLDAFLKGDGYIKDGNKIYYTSNEGLADDLQELIIRSGSYATKQTRKIKGQVKWIKDHWATSSRDGFVIRETKEYNISNHKIRNINKVDYDDYVWCVEVNPSHLIYVRRNGYCAWTGNSGVPEAVFGAIEGSFTSPNSFCIMASNPTRSIGSFHASHHQESDLWHQIQVSSKDSARVDDEYINRMKVRFGENSPVYRAKVDGIFPKDFGEEMSIFGEELKNMAVRTIDEENPKLLVIGLDIARYGSDQTVMITREGYNVFDIQNTSKKDLFQTTEWAWEHIKNFRARFPNHPIEVNIDATGLGAGVADNLKHYAKSYNRESKDKVLIRIHPVENVQKSEDPQFFNLRAESFFNAQRMMSNCTFAPDLNVDPIIKDLSSIDQKIHPSSQKIMVESKDEIKKKNHGVSPDFGDALILCLNNFSGKNYDAVRKKLIEEANLSKRKMLTKTSTFGSGTQKLSSTRWS